jgi:hypothetical protein
MGSREWFKQHADACHSLLATHILP